ncbi:MutH/Sau3AI family endonuclease [Leyella stercorea]|uniref:MutH family type II restriction endonuclease n=1 Tax=Leyella stercorea CAG:629 TaxID=1263103 RepID=R7GZV1_9BACT|nr:MutH/Sau3AI family endonuclease [Leyella stercorea]CDE32630.1 mutH family type II restriction endonuclease [Leyella stercorea CAG:629]
MAVTDDRKFTKAQIYDILENAKGKTLGEVDKSRQFDRTKESEKITGIAGDVIEQSVFGYERDSDQECDIEIDGVLTELKTTGVRIPKGDLKSVKGKTGDAYNVYLAAKEGISITGVTFEPTIQTDFNTSHFWEKSEHLLIVFYEYKSYEVVPASGYSQFPIVDYCYNSFSDEEKAKLQNDWELVRDHLQKVYEEYPDTAMRNEQLVGFTHVLRPNLLLIELVPGFKRKATGSYQKPRYRLKKTFVDYIVRGHFDKSRTQNEIVLKDSFSSFAQLDARCHALSLQYKGKTIAELKEMLGITTSTKDMAAICVIRMFGTDCKKLNQISDFAKVGIIAKTITITPQGGRTEDMKLKHIDFEEWADREADFEDSDVYDYFCEHSFLCPIFCEHDSNDQSKTTFEGFKRFAFDDDFIENEVRRTWEDSRKLIHTNKLEWEYLYDKQGNKRINNSGACMGAPNFPKSSDYKVFFRGGADVSTDKSRTECVNGIRMLPQFFWLKGSYIADKLQKIPYI